MRPTQTISELEREKDEDEDEGGKKSKNTIYNKTLLADFFFPRRSSIKVLIDLNGCSWVLTQSREITPIIMLCVQPESFQAAVEQHVQNWSFLSSMRNTVVMLGQNAEEE